MKVIILIPYFGGWPPWIDFFLKTCAYNPGFTWIMLSDAGKPGKCPPNVRFEPFSMEDFNRLASSRLGLEIAVRNPYKLCDFRPAFGVIFADYLSDADFWGYSDLDLVYGELDRFLDPDILDNNDVISVREEYLAGHFALFRNADKINNLFRLSPVHGKVFNDRDKHYAFDERSNLYGRRLAKGPGRNSSEQTFSFFELMLNKLKYRLGIGLPESPEDMNSVVTYAEKKGEIRVSRKSMVRSDLWFFKHKIPDWKIEWNRGKLIDPSDNEELLHFHFIRSKRMKEFVVEPITGDEGFVISPDGIRPI
jgi:hypothetical protein